MRSQTPHPESYALDSAGNALRVVKLLRTRRSLTITEVSRELGVGKSTAHRLLSSLIAEGFALRDPVKRRYHPGRALVETGLAALGRAPGSGNTMNHTLRELATFTGGSVKLLVLDGPYVRVLEATDADSSRPIGGTVGSLLPAHKTAGGRVLLAAEPDSLVRERLGAGLDQREPTTFPDWSALLEELAVIRGRGWAVNNGDATPDVSGLAVPVIDQNGSTLTSLSVAFPTTEISQQQHVTILQRLFACAYELARSHESL